MFSNALLEPAVKKPKLNLTSTLQGCIGKQTGEKQEGKQEPAAADWAAGWFKEVLSSARDSWHFLRTMPPVWQYWACMCMQCGHSNINTSTVLQFNTIDKEFCEIYTVQF